MAITWNGLIYSGEVDPQSTTYSLPVTVPSGNNKVLVFGHGQSGDPSGVSFTFNGVGATVAAEVASPDNIRRRIGYFVNPPAGTYNLTATSGINENHSMWALTIEGAKQGAPNVSNTATVSSNTTLTVNYTTTAADCWSFAHVGYGGTLTAGSGATALSSSPANSGFYSGGSLGASGAKSMTINSNSNANGGIAIAAFEPAPEVVAQSAIFFGAAF